MLFASYMGKSLLHIGDSIVAVHGLGGHWEESWTADNDVFWLKNLLHNEAKHARILTFGYSANATPNISGGKLTLREYAGKLIDALLGVRDGDIKVVI